MPANHRLNRMFMAMMRDAVFMCDPEDYARAKNDMTTAARAGIGRGEVARSNERDDGVEARGDGGEASGDGGEAIGDGGEAIGDGGDGGGTPAARARGDGGVLGAETGGDGDGDGMEVGDAAADSGRESRARPWNMNQLRGPRHAAIVKKCRRTIPPPHLPSRGGGLQARVSWVIDFWVKRDTEIRNKRAEIAKGTASEGSETRELLWTEKDKDFKRVYQNQMKHVCRRYGSGRYVKHFSRVPIRSPNCSKSAESYALTLTSPN